MYIRTTTLGSSTMMTNYILQGESKYNQLAEEASSGKKSVLSSTAAVNLLNTNQKLNQLSGYNDNMSLAQNELNVLDDTLSSTTDQLQAANDLAVQAANGTCSQDQLNNIKIQIDQITQNMQDLSNTQYNGNYIFSGTNTSTQTYTTDPITGDITYNGTPQTGQYQRYVQIADGVSEVINAPGDQVYGSYNTKTAIADTKPGDVAGTTTNTTTDANGNKVTTITTIALDAGTNKTTTTTQTATGILGSLKLLSNALGSGDNTAIRSSLDSLQTEQNVVSTVRTNFASVSQRFDMTTSANNTLTTQLTQYKSSLEDVDLAQTLTQLSAQQYSLQASMSVTSQMMGLSLLNYM